MNKVKTQLPCRLCGLAGDIPFENHKDARYCVFFDVRIPADEVSDPNSTMRKRCVLDGNHFTWKIRSTTPIQRFEHIVRLSDWAEQRRQRKINIFAMRIGIVIAASSLLMTAIGIWVN